MTEPNDDQLQRPRGPGFDFPVLIEWLDSRGVSSEWEDYATAVRSLVTCYSVGWVLSDTGESVVLMPHVCRDERMGTGTITIPRAAIVRIHTLLEARGVARRPPKEDKA